jgi:hypothetical protein
MVTTSKKGIAEMITITVENTLGQFTKDGTYAELVNQICNYFRNAGVKSFQYKTFENVIYLTTNNGKITTISSNDRKFMTGIVDVLENKLF